MTPLQIVDQGGTDLLLNPLQMMERQVVSGLTGIAVYAVVQQFASRVRAQLDWNDGTVPVQFPEQDSPLIINATRNLGLGTYSVELTGFNTHSPEPDQVSVLFPWQITQLNLPAPPARDIFGPILPRDSGLPNAQTWNFDLDADLRLIQSNIKMLLITAKGERVMLPDYGTNLKRIIFELNVATVESILQQEIAQAVAQWEPRVTLQTISIVRDENNRQVTVQTVFLSRQSGQPIDVNLQFAQ